MAEADPHALEVLYDQHIRAMYGLALRILQDHGDAAAVVQEVFSHAWSRMQQPDGTPEPPAAWLLATTRRRAIERLRARSASSPDDPVVVELPMPAIADERPPLPSEAVSRLRAALTALPGIDRPAIELAALEGMTAAQIAERLEQSPARVRTGLRTGLLTLREALKA